MGKALAELRQYVIHNCRYDALAQTIRVAQLPYDGPVRDSLIGTFSITDTFNLVLRLMSTMASAHSCICAWNIAHCSVSHRTLGEPRVELG